MGKIFISKSAEETQKLAQKLWAENREASKKRSSIFALYGDFGSGKTTFVKGLARAMGVTDLVRSPSYTLVNEYNGGRLVHVDLWRTADKKEFQRLGVERYLRPGTVVAIEWAEKAQDWLKKIDANVVHLKFEHLDANTRQITTD